MPFKNNFLAFEKHFVMPFCLSLFAILISVSILGLKFRLLSDSLILYAGLSFGFIAFFLWFRKLNEGNKTRELILEFLSPLFLMSLLIMTISNLSFLSKFDLTLIKNLNPILILISVFAGYITFYSKKGKLSDVETELSEELLSEGKRKHHFSIKFPSISKIPVLNHVAKWIYKEGYFYSISLILVTSLFLIFGLNHLGQFMSVDEPKWADVRVPQLFKALEEHDWEATYINDKPGILPAFLSGAVNLFLDYEIYKSNPLMYEKYLFFWRLPILLFNFLMLFVIYHFVKKLLKKDHALLITSLIALNPILIGISQIVNPDATLWSVGFLSFITFFIYLKTNLIKYVYYSGIFLGLALISKYFASIFYIIFFVVIYLEYLQCQTAKEQFLNRCIHLATLYGISILTYILLFPATWVNSSQIIKGTMGSDILSSGIQYFILFLFFAISELIIFKGKITNYLKNKFDIDIGKILTYFFGFALFVGFIVLLTNVVLSNIFFDFNDYLKIEYVRGFSISIQTILASGYTTIFVLTYPILIGILLFPVIFIGKKYHKELKNKLLILNAIYVTVTIFYVGSFIGGYILDTRYQILLYPLFSTLACILILAFCSNKKLVTAVIIIFLCITITQIQPFYFLYTNGLNINKYVITDAWGFGGYELAQKFNQMPDVKNIKLWFDREGFDDFFVGEDSYWRGKTNPFGENLDLDYLILSTGGERIFLKALNDYNNGKSYLYATVSGRTPILEYYKRQHALEICIQNNPNNCVWAVKIKN
jgi:4-amino-4-deoxy-L-arabinose transferase-like glycosyltransferase